MIAHRELVLAAGGRQSRGVLSECGSRRRGESGVKETTMSDMNRREMLKGLAGAGLAAALGPKVLTATPTPAQRDLIGDENQKAGTTDWLLTNTRMDPKTRYRCPWVEGYCSRTSVKAGETLAVMVSPNPPSPFVLDLYRLGYYGGKGGRHIARLGPFKGVAQPEAETRKERLRECRWEPATK